MPIALVSTGKKPKTYQDATLTTSAGYNIDLHKVDFMKMDRRAYGCVIAFNGLNHFTATYTISDQEFQNYKLNCLVDLTKHSLNVIKDLKAGRLEKETKQALKRMDEELTNKLQVFMTKEEFK